MKEESKPIEELVRIREEFNRLLKLLAETGIIRKGAPPRLMDLPTDVVEIDGKLHIYIDVPGLTEENLRVAVLRDVVIVEGEKRNKYDGGVRFHCIERSFGELQRLIELPRAVDTHAMQAEYVNGVLHITAPRIAERRGSRRPVKVEFRGD